MKNLKLIYLMNLALFVQFLLVGGSGLLMYFHYQVGGYLLRFIHDQVGILMLVFFVAHIVLNWKWIVSTTKKFSNKGKRIKENYIMNLALFVQFLLVGGSGLLMYFHYQVGGYLLRSIHDQVGILILVFFVAHIVLNWRWIVGTTAKLFVKGKKMKENEIIIKDCVSMN